MIEHIGEFLETPRVAYLSTIDLQGYPHTAPVWFAVDGGDLVSARRKLAPESSISWRIPKGLSRSVGIRANGRAI